MTTVVEKESLDLSKEGVFGTNEGLLSRFFVYALEVCNDNESRKNENLGYREKVKGEIRNRLTSEEECMDFFCPYKWKLPRECLPLNPEEAYALIEEKASILRIEDKTTEQKTNELLATFRKVAKYARKN